MSTTSNRKLKTYSHKSSSAYLETGMKVEILRRDIAPLKKVPRPWKGTIVDIDGSYIMVRPYRRRWAIELYPGEVRALK